MNWQPVAKAPMEPDASVTFESNTYLVTDGHCVATCDFARGNGAGKPWADWSMYGGIGAGRITHWMPLPAAPGAEAPVDPAGEREAFEAWFSAAHHDRLDRNMPDKSYNSPGAECAWGAWQARATSAHQTPAETVAAKEST